MNSDVILIKDVTHNYLLTALVISICVGIILYNIYSLVALRMRIKKLREAGKLIVEGYSRKSTRRKKIVIDGKTLDSSMVLDQISKTNKKLKVYNAQSLTGKQKAAEEKAKAKAKAEKRAVELSKKEQKALAKKQKEYNSRPDVLLAKIYELQDAIEMEMQIFYGSYDTEIRDDKVRHAVEKARKSKGAKARQEAAQKDKDRRKRKEKEAERRKQKNSLEHVTAQREMSIFD